jgi:hypothetical protein
MTLNTPYINTFQRNPNSYIKILLDNLEIILDDLDKIKYQVIMTEDLNIPFFLKL